MLAGRRPSYAGESAPETREALALELDYEIRRVKKADWRDNPFKRKEVRNAIKNALRSDDGLVDAIYRIVDAQHEY